MKNFIFKSTDADFKKMFQLIETIQKNVLYLTYGSDKMASRLAELELIMSKYITNHNLQKQVDDYFEETPPQTDSDEQ